MATITTHYRGDMLFETTMGNHTVQIDVPASMGGSDRGPTPPQLFVASLGACVGAFVANYCTKTGIDASDMTVDVSFNKADNPTRLTDIAVQVNLPNAECDRREEAIRRVAEHCPVHETIETMEGISIEIKDRRSLEPSP